MLRAVLDTNVIVSALILRGSTTRLADLWQEKKFLPLVSKEILEEYFRVLAYPKFRLLTEEIKELVERQFIAFAEPVEVKEVQKVISEDPSDDIFLACAVSGKAQYLVSGDQHLLTHKSYKGIPIVSVSVFLSKFTHSANP